MEEIFTRRSIRKFTNQEVEPEQIDKLLRAGGKMNLSTVIKQTRFIMRTGN